MRRLDILIKHFSSCKTDAENSKAYHWGLADTSDEDMWEAYRQQGRIDAFEQVIRTLKTAEMLENKDETKKTK